MGYLRTMGASLAGSLTKTYGNANVNQIQYGNKLQGLPPVTGRRDPYKKIKAKAGGNTKQRSRVFCVNQLGGVGMGGKNSPFAPNADGVGWCPNLKNSRQGNVGINVVDRGNNAIRFQSRGTEKKDFEEYKTLTRAEAIELNNRLAIIKEALKELNIIQGPEQDDFWNRHSLAAAGDHETIALDIQSSNLLQEAKNDILSNINNGSLETIKTLNLSNFPHLTQQDLMNIKYVNDVIGSSDLYVNRPNNGKGGLSVGIHELKIIRLDAAFTLFAAGYGLPLKAETDVDLTFFAYRG